MSRPNPDDDARHLIATALDQNLMVEAAAGTGKTTSIITRLINLIAEGRAQPGRIAAVTFTRKAAGELRVRFASSLRARINDLRALGSEINSSDAQRLERLESALADLGQVFIDTIHSFCAGLIRQRPIEFGVDLAFGEIDASAEETLRREAWEQNLIELKALADPLLGQLAEVGLRSWQLKNCFEDFLNYRDISDWPAGDLQLIDLRPYYQAAQMYLVHINKVVEQFGAGTRDDLMKRYEAIQRSSLRFDMDGLLHRLQQSSDGPSKNFFAWLEHFDKSPRLVQKHWPKSVPPKAELARFEQFKSQVVGPALRYWRQYRYQFVVRFVRRAVECYQRAKRIRGGLDFTDLLLVAANGLRSQPHLRQFFQSQFTHLLVDEFQDTDPIQAEIVTWLCSADLIETQWQKCRLRAGCLFIVGDPKQSIYRFRRGDIVTYKQMQRLFENGNGTVLPLTKNFRSSQWLLAWNNEVFEQIFAINEENQDAVAPHSPMAPAQDRPVRGDLSGVFKLMVPEKLDDDPVQWEAEQIGRWIRQAIDQQQTIEVQRDSPDGSWCCRPVRPSDFMVLTRTRKNIRLFKSALERHALECEVSGNNALSTLDQLSLLRDVLETVDDAYNPVCYLALLRDQLFGFSDAELYDFKKAGGVFQFHAAVPESLSPDLRRRFREMNKLLSQCQMWLRSLPPAVALVRIASALGLIASTVAGEQGNLALGTFLKSVEMLRARSWQFDSAADLISGINELLDQDEIEGAHAWPASGNAVRIMNLHKAKGLEAPIVFLADGSRRKDFAPHYYIARSGERPQGYMWITEKINDYVSKPLAEPGDWENLRTIEKTFQDAEEDRLLYVATTRAANMLIVTRSERSSHWSGLDKYLEDVPELLSIARECEPIHEAAGAIVPSAKQSQLSAGLALAERWRSAVQSTYDTLSIKQAALRGRKRPQWQSVAEDGIAWGTAVHQLLDRAVRCPQLDLEHQANSVALDNGIDAQRVAELGQVVRSVMTSQLWRRAQASAHCLSEVPLDTLQSSSGLPTIVRGVIDLVFEESDGWVIVDYKSDHVSTDEIANTFQYYRGQLDAYGHYWQQLTGTKVKEVGIYLTSLGEYICEQL